ncbi:hypothetical protein LZ518_04400 [Sphingomonas sp. RB56-2]|uniref:Uncharacterized protein n=1 Tax=Sphingomonas brevis TaxID=2908206 RepID=A0ABT0S7J5_9SPHN|nr:hypothetical protein [Sphingomonas brevis]MCL6740370.1 hypothetical protein [Sphingomonas brevis]
MLRHLSTVLISALLGSLVGTLIWTAIARDTGAADPVRFVAAFAAGTLWFTIPGAVALMAATFAFASRGLPQQQTAILLIVAGPLLGAAMLAMLPMDVMLLGAMFGGLTAASFVGTLWLLRAYPATSL